MALRLIRALPGDRALLPPSPADHPADLAPALERQNHTTSPSAQTPLVAQQLRPAMCVHRIPLPTSVTIASRPSSQVRDKREHRFDLPDNAIPGTCDRLARRANHRRARSHPRVSQLSSVAGCGRAAFTSPQRPTAQMKTARAVSNDAMTSHVFFRTGVSETSHAVQCRGATAEVAYMVATRLTLAWAGRCCDARRVRTTIWSGSDGSMLPISAASVA
jgi:hypothetical protein